mmetsp:Transcript_82977/g.230480  ORF Transcript_82977/g.230480 Transcript_82977/m.230480 type:complete len:271 (-) Transcript_82977:89-901(-)
MGVVLSRAEVVKGLEPTVAFTAENVRAIFQRFEECCPVPALWERAFHELLGCFPTPDATSKAFLVLDTDGNGFVDAREVIGALAILSKGHLKDRLTLLFDIFDLNKERAMAFDECFLMLRRTMGGLRKMIAIATPPEKVIHAMTKQVWRSAKKHRDTRLSLEEWHAWWTFDASIRSALKMVTWRAEDQRGLPTPDQLQSLDYTKGVGAEEPKEEALVPVQRSSRRHATGGRPLKDSRKDAQPRATGTSTVVHMQGMAGASYSDRMTPVGF